MLFHEREQAADKQLKASRQFLKAAEREQERDEFSKEIEKLRVIVKERDKDKLSQNNEVRSRFISFLIHNEIAWNAALQQKILPNYSEKRSNKLDRVTFIFTFTQRLKEISN